MNPKRGFEMAPSSPAPPATRADVLAMLARRVREYYSDRLVALYATHEDPYEPEQGEGRMVRTSLSFYRGHMSTGKKRTL